MKVGGVWRVGQMRGRLGRSESGARPIWTVGEGRCPVVGALPLLAGQVRSRAWVGEEELVREPGRPGHRPPVSGP